MRSQQIAARRERGPLPPIGITHMKNVSDPDRVTASGVSLCGARPVSACDSQVTIQKYNHLCFVLMKSCSTVLRSLQLRSHSSTPGQGTGPPWPPLAPPLGVESGQKNPKPI